MQKAIEQGVSLEDYAIQLLATAVPNTEKNTKLVNLLQEWMDQGDVEEQQETGNYSNPI